MGSTPIYHLDIPKSDSTSSPTQCKQMSMTSMRKNALFLVVTDGTFAHTRS